MNPREKLFESLNYFLKGKFKLNTLSENFIFIFLGVIVISVIFLYLLSPFHSFLLKPLLLIKVFFFIVVVLTSLLLKK